MLFKVENLKFSYNEKKEVFKELSFELDKGEILSILGPNGSGKSTLLNCLSSLQKSSDGNIFLDGMEINWLTPSEIAKVIGYVQQINTPTYAYTVREFAVMGRAPYIGMFSKPDSKDYELVDEALESLNISHLADKPYTEISGGERQQASIARVIVQQPKIIMLDEPTAHLDYGNQLRTIKMIKGLADKGYSIIMTTHQPDHSIILGGYTGILGCDGIMKIGKSEEILNESILSEIYNLEIKLIEFNRMNRKICIPLIE